jgi:hypothetical protein
MHNTVQVILSVNDWAEMSAPKGEIRNGATVSTSEPQALAVGWLALSPL